MQAHLFGDVLDPRAAVVDSTGHFAAILLADQSCELHSLAQDFRQLHVPCCSDVAFLQVLSKPADHSRRPGPPTRHETDGSRGDNNAGLHYALMAGPCEGHSMTEVRAWQCLSPEQDIESPFRKTSLLIKSARNGQVPATVASTYPVSSQPMPEVPCVTAGFSQKAILNMPHGKSMKLSASVNFAAFFPVETGQIWLVSARAPELGKLVLSVCSVVDCLQPTYGVHLSPEHLLVGQIGGITVWPLRPLVKGGSTGRRGMSVKKPSKQSPFQQADSSRVDDQVTTPARHDSCTLDDGGFINGISGEAQASSALSNEGQGPGWEKSLGLEKGSGLREAGPSAHSSAPLQNGFVEDHQTFRDVSRVSEHTRLKQGPEVHSSGFPPCSPPCTFIPFPEQQEMISGSRAVTERQVPGRGQAYLGPARNQEESIQEMSPPLAQASTNQSERAKVVGFQELGFRQFLVLSSDGRLRTLRMAGSTSRPAGSERAGTRPGSSSVPEAVAAEWILQTVWTSMAVRSLAAFPYTAMRRTAGGTELGPRVWLADSGLSIHSGFLELLPAGPEDEEQGQRARHHVRMQVEHVVMARSPGRLLAALSPTTVLAAGTGGPTVYAVDGS